MLAVGCITGPGALTPGPLGPAGAGAAGAAPEAVDVALEVDAFLGPGERRLVSAGDALHSGARFALQVTVDKPAYVYVAYAPPHGSPRVIFLGAGPGPRQPTGSSRRGAQRASRRLASRSCSTTSSAKKTSTWWRPFSLSRRRTPPWRRSSVSGPSRPPRTTRPRSPRPGEEHRAGHPPARTRAPCSALARTRRGGRGALFVSA